MDLKKTGDWNKLRKLNRISMERIIKSEFGKSILKNGEIIRKSIVEGIRRDELGLAANAPSTIIRKKGDTPVVDSGELTNSVNIVKINWDEIFIGVPRGATTSKGGDMLRIAEIVHEGYGNKPKRDFIIRAFERVKKELKENFEVTGKNIWKKLLR